MALTTRSGKGSALTFAEMDANLTGLADGSLITGTVAANVPNAIVDLKGDLIAATAPDTVARLAVGANNTRLVADSTQTTGLKYVADTINYAVAAKGDLLAGTASQTLAAKSVGTDGQSLQADSSQTSGLVYIDNPARPNLLINPNWQIDQINEGALYTVTGGGADIQGPDGWSGTAVAAPGVFKLRTLADPDNAALKCLEITCTTADAAIAATDDYHIYTAIEGYDATSLLAGTASAQTITIQFKFKSNVTGVYGISVANSAKNRSYVGIITVADTSEHEYVVTLMMDTAGTWLYTNGVGLYLRLTLAAGSNFQAAAGAWNAANNLTTSAQANFMSVNTNIAYLKRIQLIPGSLVQAYRPADIQKELAKAQRYYEKSFPQGTAPSEGAATYGNALVGMQTIGAATLHRFPFEYKVEKRANPGTITFWNPRAGGATGQVTNAAQDWNTTTAANQGMGGFELQATSRGGGANSEPAYVFVTANARLS